MRFSSRKYINIPGRNHESSFYLVQNTNGVVVVLVGVSFHADSTTLSLLHRDSIVNCFYGCPHEHIHKHVQTMTKKVNYLFSLFYCRESVMREAGFGASGNSGSTLPLCLSFPIVKFLAGDNLVTDKILASAYSSARVVTQPRVVGGTI